MFLKDSKAAGSFSRIVLIIFVICFLPGRIHAQQRPVTNPGGDEKWAKAFMMAGDFVNAMKEYVLLVKKDSLNSEFNYYLASCYLNSSIDKTKALQYMLVAVKDPKMDPVVFYDLGRAYQYRYQFDEAIEAFKKYKSMISGADPNYISSDMQIEMCQRAKEMVQHPVNVVFENLGGRVNSAFPDYHPYITKNENTLYYTSKRNGNTGNLMDYDGYFTADLFMVENKYGAWDKCKRLPTTINTPLIEEMSGLSEDGSLLFAYVDNLDARFQVRFAQKEGKSMGLLQPLGTVINPNNQGASAATISHDKKTLIFAADRDGGQGGSDLWMSRALPNGGWSTPENLGSVLNTSFDEDFPQLALNDQRLYFASVGHNSIGGYDLYYSDRDAATGQWQKPVNLGYPVNTTDDNFQISFTASGRYGYMAALRPEGYGNLDIYRVIFRDVKSSYTVLRGLLASRDSMNVFDVFRGTLAIGIDSIKTSIDPEVTSVLKTPADTIAARQEIIRQLQSLFDKGPSVVMTVIDKTNGKIIGQYRPNRQTGRFAIALEAGDYTIKTVCDGYDEYTAEIRVPDMEMPVKEINQNFVLTPHAE